MNYYYLAYGSNMNKEQMKKRCPGAESIKVGYLKGYKLEFNGYSKRWQGPVANIVKDDDSTIPYVLWLINENDFDVLDRCEGHPVNYERKEIHSEELSIEVIIYEMTTNNKNSKEPGLKVSKKYEEAIRKSYKLFNLSETYLDKALKEV